MTRFWLDGKNLIKLLRAMVEELRGVSFAEYFKRDRIGGLISFADIFRRKRESRSKLPSYHA